MSSAAHSLAKSAAALSSPVRSAAIWAKVRPLVGRRHLGHRVLVVEPLLGALEVRRSGRRSAGRAGGRSPVGSRRSGRRGSARRRRRSGWWCRRGAGSRSAASARRARLGRCGSPRPAPARPPVRRRRAAGRCRGCAPRKRSSSMVSRSSSAISSSTEDGHQAVTPTTPRASSSRARNCSNCAPISSPLGIGSSSASRLLPCCSAREGVVLLLEAGTTSRDLVVVGDVAS